MTKVVRVDEVTYTDLVHISAQMMTDLGKPFSLGMSVRLAVVVLDNYMQTNDWKKLMKILEKCEVPSPDEFMDRFEKKYRQITQDENSGGP